MVTVHIDHPSSILYASYLKWSSWNIHFLSLSSLANPWLCHNQCQSLPYTSLMHHIPHPTFTSSAFSSFIRSPALTALQISCSPVSTVSFSWLLPLSVTANFGYQYDIPGKKEGTSNEELFASFGHFLIYNWYWRVQSIVDGDICGPMGFFKKHNWTLTWE